MSTLTYTTDALAHPATAARPASTRKSFWRAIYDGMMASRQRQAEREIATYLQGHGGLLTDDMEREIMRRMTAHQGHFGG